MNDDASSRQGKIFDGISNPDISLYFASYDDINELCNVINWAYRGKPSTTLPVEKYSGWVTEQHILSGARITPDELRELIDDEQRHVILVAKLKRAPGQQQIVGCFKISACDKNLQVGEEEKNDIAVDFGLEAVDPDYQSRGIATLMYKGALHIAKEYFHAQRIYSYIIQCKRNQIEWHFRQGFIDTKRFEPFIFGDRYQAKIDPSEIKFSVLTKRLE